jgi:hypothetical protein
VAPVNEEPVAVSVVPEIEPANGIEGVVKAAIDIVVRVDTAWDKHT